MNTRTLVCVFLLSVSFEVVNLQKGSGTNGNLRLCIVERAAENRRAAAKCPLLETKRVECVIGSDRLDCLRRMGKGTVDFGVFQPEQLVAALWADIDVLVTDELRSRQDTFEHKIVTVVSRDLLSRSRPGASPATVLRGASLCHPGHGTDTLSDACSNYLESLVTEQSCDPGVSMAENRLRATEAIFSEACKPGPWVPDPIQDLQLKQRYKSLCAKCYGGCTKADKYWGPAGALSCLGEGGDVTWSRLSDVSRHFGLSGTVPLANPGDFAYLCRDGSWQPLKNNSSPCVWLSKPWPVLVAKRGAAALVSQLAQELAEDSIRLDPGWRGALAELLELNSGLVALSPPLVPQDYLARAKGFREAYSVSSCNPPRHITVCTASTLDLYKCEWLGEAGTVYGAEPPVQCVRRPSLKQCMMDLHSEHNHVDAVVASADWIVAAKRDYKAVPVLLETTPIVEHMLTVVPFVRADSKFAKMADLKGAKAYFSKYDGIAWHSVIQHLITIGEISTCDDYSLARYFGESCAPGIIGDDWVEDKMMKLCYDDDEIIENDELAALRAVVEGRADVAFLSHSTEKMFKEGSINKAWAYNSSVELKAICPAGSGSYCFLSWATRGQVYVSSSLGPTSKEDIVNAFKELDRLFGYKSPSKTFSMYGPFNYVNNVIFHDATRFLSAPDQLKNQPYNRYPMNFESTILNRVDRCLTSAGKMAVGHLMLVLSLAVSLAIASS